MENLVVVFFFFQLVKRPFPMNRTIFCTSSTKPASVWDGNENKLKHNKPWLVWDWSNELTTALSLVVSLSGRLFELQQWWHANSLPVHNANQSGRPNQTNRQCDVQHDLVYLHDTNETEAGKRLYKNTRWHDTSQNKSQIILIATWWLAAAQFINPVSSVLVDGKPTKLKSQCTQQIIFSQRWFLSL